MLTGTAIRFIVQTKAKTCVGLKEEERNLSTELAD